MYLDTLYKVIASTSSGAPCHHSSLVDRGPPPLTKSLRDFVSSPSIAVNDHGQRSKILDPLSCVALRYCSMIVPWLSSMGLILESIYNEEAAKVKMIRITPRPPGGPARRAPDESPGR